MNYNQRTLAAYREDGQNPDGLYQALHGLRCLGARLEPAAHGGRGVRLVATDIERYGELRARWLLPHRERLKRLLESVHTRPKREVDNVRKTVETH